jgi:hypothetical protein
MSSNLPPDLSKLSGPEVANVAAALSAAPVNAILARSTDLIAMDTDDIQKLANLASSARANCGGFGCG